MTQLGIQPPQPLELVGSAQADEIISATERELLELQRTADAAEHAADDAEAQARASGADLDASPWALVRMQTFIDGLRAEVARDIETMLGTARRHAGARIPDAPATERSIDLTMPSVPAPTEHRTPSPDIEPVEITHAAAALLAEPLVPPAAETAGVETPPTTAAPVEALPPEALVVEALVAVPPSVVATTVVPEPEIVTPVVAAPDVPGDASETPVVDEQILFTPPQRVEPSVSEQPTVLPPPPVAPASAVVADVVPSDVGEPIGKERRAKRDKRRGFPISTVLEVLAVVLVLVFILLRLG